MNASYYFIRTLILAALLTLSAAAAHANPDIYQHVLRSTALISTGNSWGSGALIDLDNRLVITCFHVVDDSKVVNVYFAGYDENGELVTDRDAYEDNFDALRSTGLAMKGHVVAIWKEKDLALVQLEDLPCDAHALPLAAETALRGESVQCVGNSGVAEGTLWRYTRGTVRNVYVKNELGFRRDVSILETDCASNGGDSGGPVVNDRGELVGVVSGGEWVVGYTQDGRLAISGGQIRQQMLVSYEVEVREVHALLEWFFEDDADGETVVPVE
jgi:S1-C subfamily serine protease